MTATDCFANVEHTYDGPTAVTRLDVVLRGLARDGGTIAATLINDGIKGNPSSLGKSPIEVWLHARIGCDVAVGERRIVISTPDWDYSQRTPEWLVAFVYDCEAGIHPLIEGEPCTGTATVLDVFAGLVR